MENPSNILDDAGIKRKRDKFKTPAIIFNGLSILTVLVQILRYFTIRAQLGTELLADEAHKYFTQPYLTASILSGIMAITAILLYSLSRKGWSIFFSVLAILTPTAVHLYYNHFVSLPG